MDQSINHSCIVLHGLLCLNKLSITKKLEDELVSSASIYLTNYSDHVIFFLSIIVHTIFFIYIYIFNYISYYWILIINKIKFRYIIFALRWLTLHDMFPRSLCYSASDTWYSFNWSISTLVWLKVYWEFTIKLFVYKN